MNTGNGSERTGGTPLRMIWHSTVRLDFLLLKKIDLAIFFFFSLFVWFGLSSPFFLGNDVSLFESQQLDECNNNVEDDNEVVVLQSAPNSKTSSNSSSPSPSLHSSHSSSPPSPSSTSSSSDAVSLKAFINVTVAFEGGLFSHPLCLLSTGLWWHTVQDSQTAGQSGLQRPQGDVCCRQ